jgi:DNA-binding transcriptional LysR family regulator
MRPHELKLLVIFDVIMTENSITRAAEQLSMTQPAVSNAVARMRTLWKNELFVPDGRKIQPTSYAKNLWEKIRDPLHNLNQAVEPDNFSPQTVKRTFRIALPDIALDALWLDMRLLFEQEAQGLNLHAVPYTINDTKQLLDDADVDLVIGQSNRSLENICSDHLFDTSYVCVMRKGHFLAKPNLTIEEFAAAEHLLVSLSGNSAGPTDQALHQLGLTRRVAFTVNQFSSAVPIIKESNLIAILPTDLVHKSLACDELSITHSPIDIPHTSISMLWHKRQSADEGLIWLRRQIKTIFINRRTRQIKEVYQYIDQ